MLILALEAVGGTLLLALAVHLAVEEVAPEVLVFVLDDDAEAVGQVVVEVAEEGVLVEVELAVLALLVVLVEEASEDGAGGVLDFPRSRDVLLVLLPEFLEVDDQRGVDFVEFVQLDQFRPVLAAAEDLPHGFAAKY